MSKKDTPDLLFWIVLFLIAIFSGLVLILGPEDAKGADVNDVNSAADVNDVNAVADQVRELATITVPKKQKELKTKVYPAATFDEFIAARDADVNEINNLCKQAEVKADFVAQKKGWKARRKTAIKKLMREKVKKEKNEKRKRNLDLIKAAQKLVNDQQAELDPNDPNYIEAAERNANFMNAVIKETDPK